MLESRASRKVHFRQSPLPSPGAHHSHGNGHGGEGPTTGGRLRWLLILAAIVGLGYITVVNMFHRSVDARPRSGVEAPKSAAAAAPSVATSLSSSTTTTTTSSSSLRGKGAPLPDVALAAKNTPGVPATLAVRPAALPPSSSLGAPVSAQDRTVKSFKKLELLSKGRPATGDVHGNLGAPAVITNESIGNWLTDRWQAALNMKGEAIPGEHWVEIDLQRPCRVEKVLIDWEDAYSTFWTLEGRATAERGDASATVVLGRGSEAKQIRKMKHHVVFELHTALSRDQHRIKEATLHEHHAQRERHGGGADEAVRYVRLVIHKPSLHWGSSIWRLQLWGTEAAPPL